jgi:putative serine protease PepD
VVTAVDGERVDSALSLVGQVRERSVGDKVTLTVLRDGGTIEVEVALAARSTADN